MNKEIVRKREPRVRPLTEFDRLVLVALRASEEARKGDAE